MRYVNLRKKSTKTLDRTVKKCTIASLMLLVFTAFIVLPLTARANAQQMDSQTRQTILKNNPYEQAGQIDINY